MAQDLPVYDEIERCFLASGSEARLFACINDSGFEVLSRDLNHGLAKQALTALTRHRIRRLTKTYVTMSLEQIAAAVGAADAQVVEGLLVSMARAREITAQIDVTTGMVHFGDAPSAEGKRSNEQLNHLLEASIDQTMLLSDRLRELQRTVLTSSSFILKSIPGAQRNEGGGRGGSVMHGGMGGWGGEGDMDVY